MCVPGQVAWKKCWRWLNYYPFGLNMEGPWARQYQKDEQGETVLDEEGNPVVDREKLNRYQYNGKELTEDLGLE